MRPSLKDQGSHNASKWASQRKEQLERSRQSSREKTNFAAVGDMAMGGLRGNSAPRKNQNSQERGQKQQIQVQEKPRPIPVVQNQPNQLNHQSTRTNSNNRINETQTHVNQQKPPQQSNPTEASSQLRLLKHKMSTGATNSRQGPRDQYNLDEQVIETKNTQQQQYSTQNEWEKKNNSKQSIQQQQMRQEPSTTNSTSSSKKIIFQEPVQKNSQIPPRNNRANTYKDKYEEEDNNIEMNKKPPINSLQKKNTTNDDQDAYQQQTQSEKKVPPNKKPPVKQNAPMSKKVEYQNYDSNPFNYDNPYDDEPARATGKLELPVPMYADPDDEDQELNDCPEGCGRRFNEKALDRHIKICQKVFQSKRKQFNTKEHRILDGEHAQLLKQVQSKGKQGKIYYQDQDQQKQKKVSKGPIEERPIIGAKKPKWQAQSEAFRAVLKGSSGQQLSKEENAAITEAQNSDLIQCTYCGRRFNESAAKKHISFCETKAKQNKMKQAPQKPLPSNNKSYK